MHVVSADRRGERAFAAFDAGLRAAVAQGGAGIRGSLRIDQHHGLRSKLQRLFHDSLPATMSAQHADRESLRMQRNDGERAAPDAPRRTQDRDALPYRHGITPEPKSPSA